MAPHDEFSRENDDDDDNRSCFVSCYLNLSCIFALPVISIQNEASGCDAISYVCE